MSRVWRLKSNSIDSIVRAADQFEAWDTLRDRPLSHFGLVVTAEPDESGDPIPVHTSALLFSWGRDHEARMLIDAAVSVGLPDTTEADLEYAKERNR